VNNLIFNTVAEELRTLVSGTVTVSGISGSITVSEITSPVTIANASLTVSVAGSTFTSDSVTSTVVSGTGAVFDNTDISTLKVASMFVYNEGVDPLTISLQISPTASDTDYIDDPSYTEVVVNAGEAQYMAVNRFANYCRLQYVLGVSTATFSAYFNAQA